MEIVSNIQNRKACQDVSLFLKLDLVQHHISIGDNNYKHDKDDDDDAHHSTKPYGYFAHDRPV